jgi:hypothetical protein
VKNKPITYLSQVPTKVNSKSMDEKPLLILIKMPSINQAASLLKEINTGAVDYAVFQQFSIQKEQSLITINIKNTQNTEFCNGFLIALSDTIQGYILLDANKINKEKISFFLEGSEAAAAGSCLASCGLWGEHYSFSDKAQEVLFHEYHEKIKKAIKLGTQELAKKRKETKQ